MRLGGNYTNWIIPFLFTLTVIVFFHELGHFLVARLCGIRVLVFSIGFGPELVGFNDRQRHPLEDFARSRSAATSSSSVTKMRRACPTPRRLAAMTEEERKHSFPGQPVGARAAVVAAGPIANFILAIVIFAGVFMVYGKTTAIPRIAAVEPGSAAAAAGFKAGDLIIVDRRHARSTTSWTCSGS